MTDRKMVELRWALERVLGLVDEIIVSDDEVKQHKQHKHWTDKDKQELFNLISKGKTYEEVAPLLGRSTASCQKQYWLLTQQ